MRRAPGDAPNGQVELSGSSNVTIAAGVFADRIKLNGISINRDASSLGGGDDVLELIE